MSAFSTSVKLSGILNHALARLTTDAAIGVDSTLAPEVNLNGVASWVDRSGGIPIGFPRLTFSVRQPNKATRAYKVMVKLVLPTLEQTSPSTMTGIQPAPTLAYNVVSVMEFLLPERSTQAEREKLFSRTASLFCDVINASDGTPTDSVGSPLKAAVTTFETVY